MIKTANKNFLVFEKCSQKNLFCLLIGNISRRNEQISAFILEKPIFHQMKKKCLKKDKNINLPKCIPYSVWNPISIFHCHWLKLMPVYSLSLFLHSNILQIKVFDLDEARFIKRLFFSSSRWFYSIYSLN